MPISFPIRVLPGDTIEDDGEILYRFDAPQTFDRESDLQALMRRLAHQA